MHPLSGEWVETAGRLPRVDIWENQPEGLFPLTVSANPQLATARSATGGGEVLVVGIRPGTAPSPADAGEGPDDRASGRDQARDAPVAADELPAFGRVHAASGDVRVPEGVDVDRPAVGVLGPVRGPESPAAVEGRGVVGRHRTVV